jgi:DNA processing protein
MAARALCRADGALRDADRLGMQAIALGAPDYPALLTQIADPPPLLWVRGATAVLARRSVAVVGSRSACPASLEVAATLGEDLAAGGLVVVSGLARGVDAAAHRGALDRGPTVAVVGAGCDRVYPPEHATLTDAIAATGAIVAELPPGTPPRREHFPRRNRIISGLCLGIVVVEASDRSGSLITARLALEQGREVMAVPGPVLGSRHRGTHALIRDGAALVEHAGHVLDALGLASSAPGVATPEPRSAADPILEALGEGEAYDVQQLGARAGMDVATVLRRLATLELAGRVARAAGGRFFRPLRGVVR